MAPSTTAAKRRPVAPPPPPRRHPVLKISAIVVAALALLFLVGWAGWAINNAVHPAKDVTVQSTFNGTVGYVGNGGRSGCITPVGGGTKKVCSIFVQEAQANPLHQGEQVQVAHIWIKNARGSSDALLIYP